jgi:hypothetical protein
MVLVAVAASMAVVLALQADTQLLSTRVLAVVLDISVHRSFCHHRHLLNI